MSPAVDMYMIVALAFAVFAAVAAVGTSLVLGIGFERVRSGLERVKEAMERVNKQTGYFSDAIYKLDKKVVSLDEKQVAMAKDNLLEAGRIDSLVRHAESLVDQANNTKANKIANDINIDDFVPTPIKLSMKEVDEVEEDSLKSLVMFNTQGSDFRIM